MKPLPKPEICTPPKEAILFAGRFSAEIPGPDLFDVFGKRIPKVDYQFLQDFKLVEAPDIYIVRGTSRGEISKNRLEAACSKDSFGWRVNDGSRLDRKFWAALLKTDSPMIFCGLDPARAVLRALTRVALYANHSLAIGEDGWEVCKRVITSKEGAVVLGIGTFRMDVQFAGRGVEFEQIVEEALELPQEYFGYTKNHMKEVARWKKMVF